MEAENEYRIELSGVSPSEIQRLAPELKEQLETRAFGIKPINLVSAGGNTQDPASILILILGTKFAVEIAKGISAFLVKRAGVEVNVTLPNGTKVSLSGPGTSAGDVLESMQLQK